MRHYFIKFSYKGIFYTAVTDINLTLITSDQIHSHFYMKCRKVLVQANVIDKAITTADIMPNIDIVMIESL